MVISLKDFDRCCRCCLSVVDVMRPIFGACLDNMFTKLTNLQVTRNDGYPQQMCQRCILKLSSAYTFYTTVTESQKTLEDILKEAEKNGVVSIPVDSFDHSKELNIPKKEIIQSLEDTSCIRDFNPAQDTITTKQELKETEISSNSEPCSDKEGDYQCSECEHTSNNPEDLQGHIQTHLIVNNGVLPKTEATLNAHLCNICGAHFQWRTSLYKHIRQHRGSKHRCEHCHKIFAEATSLKVHLVSHSAEPKPFQCNICGCSFTQQSSLRKHAKKHDTRDQMQCSDCDKSFLHKYSLQRHQESCHMRYKCTLCNNIFAGKKSLAGHMKRHRRGKVSTTVGTLNDEIVTESMDTQAVTVEFLCLLCSNKFQTRESLEMHTCSKEITLPL